MTRGPKIVFGVLFAGVAMTIGGLAAVYLLLSINEAHAPPVPRVGVPARFLSLRDTPGHLVHVRDAKLACTECHDVAKNGFAVPSETLCTAKCHVDQVSTIHEASTLASSSLTCQSCHGFNEDRALRPKNCVRCHGEKQGFMQAVVLHAKQDCTTCHNPHKRPSLDPKPCSGCHEETTTHAGAGDQALTCLDCHRMHDGKGAANQRCRDCHGRTAPGKLAISARATFTGGHEACASCHVPHRFSKETVKPCISCHTDQPVLGAMRAPPHAQCVSCHAPHDASPAAARTRCVTCHAGVHPDHPPDARGGACVGCHPIHDRSIALALTTRLPPKTAALLSVRPARACSTCHTKAGSDSGFHAKQLTCESCHQPHAFSLAGQGTKPCVGCHRDEAAKAAGNTGHRQCLSCHTTASHAPATPRPACASCHPQEQATAPSGHQRCAQCHDTHSGELLAKARTCASCHADEASHLHGGTMVPGGCQTCHRPHASGTPTPTTTPTTPARKLGPAKPPACTTCHAPSSLPSLHQVPAHQTCLSCHAPHLANGIARSDRATCAACHDKGPKGAPLATHEPTATKCSGCHVFGRGRF